MDNQQTQQATISCIQVGPNTTTVSVQKREGFTTNKDYLGHTISGIPVYVNEKLAKGEIKTIMQKENQEIERLEPGTYKAKVVQVYEKTNAVDANKKMKIIELEVEGKTDKQYVMLFQQGYSEMQLEVSKKNTERMIQDFNLAIIEELAGKEVSLVSKRNNKGYINYFIYPVQKQMNWDGEYQLPCTIFSYSKKADTNNVILGVKFRFNGEEYVDFVWYSLNNEFSAKDFERVCIKTGWNPNAIMPSQNIQATLKVSLKPSKKDPTKKFVNKKIIIK